MSKYRKVLGTFTVPDFLRHNYLAQILSGEIEIPALIWIFVFFLFFSLFLVYSGVNSYTKYINLLNMNDPIVEKHLMKL